MKKYLSYVYALLAVPLAILLHYALMPLIGHGVPYVSLFVVTGSVAVLGGLIPAVITAVFGAIATDYFFIEPFYTLHFSITFISQMFVVVLTSAFIGYIGDELRKARIKAESQTLALRDSEERFRLALKNAPVSVAAQDRSLRYIWAYNQRTARREEIIGHFDHEIFTPEETANFTAIKQRVLKEGIELREQMWLNRPEGRIYLDICWAPIRDINGQIIGIGSATVDLTSIKQAEEALRESNEELNRFNRAAVGRELRIIELKKEVNNLCSAAGQPLRYLLDFEKEKENEQKEAGTT